MSNRIMPALFADKLKPLASLLFGFAVAGVLIHLAWLSGVGQGEVDALVDDWLYNGVLFAAGAVCLIRAVGSSERVVWLSFGLGLTAWTIGDVIWTVAFAEMKKTPYPSWSDVAYLAAYPFLYVGVLTFVRHRVRFTASSWLDGAIGVLATAALASAILAPALVGLTKGDSAAVATNLAYPLGDVLLVSFLLAGVALAGARRGRTMWLLGIGLATWAVADAIYLYQEATSSYAGGYLDSMWLIGSVFMALAALTSNERWQPREELHSVFFPVFFATVALGVLVWSVAGEHDGWAVWLAVATIGVVILRFLLSFRENIVLMRTVRAESLTDSLTGLANRRALWRELERIEAGRETTVIALYDLDGFKAYNDTFGHPAGDLLLRRMGAGLAAAVEPRGRAFRLGGDEFCVLIADDQPEEATEVALAAARVALFEEGEGFRIGASAGMARFPGDAPGIEQALRIADAQMYAHKGGRSTSAQRQTHDVLVRILREREPAMSEYLLGAARLAVEMGRRLRLSAEELDVLARAAQLHDIGKIAIPDRLLHKPWPLDSVEWELMRSHAEIGERILRAAPAMNPVADLVRSSHERWDGAGYPDRLAGEAIPLGARIIFICDAFEAMTSPRAYREANDVGAAIEELRRCSGSQFDPDLIDLFVNTVHPASLSRPVTGSEDSETIEA